MRTTLWWALLLGLLAPLAAASPGHTELASDSPLALHGTVRATGASLALYHLAFADGSLSGLVHNGTLVDHVRVSGCGSDRWEDRPVRTVSADQIGLSLYWELGKESLAIVRYGAVREAAVAQGPAERSDAPTTPPDAYLGPNPYAFQTEQEPPAPYSPSDDWVLAFPTTPFLLVPSDLHHSDLAASVYLLSGNLSLQQQGRSEIYSPHDTTEDATCPSPTILPPLPQQVRLHHTYRLDVRIGGLDARQGSLADLLGYYSGDTGFGTPPAMSRMPPAGYWPENQGANLAASWDAYRLPRTLYTDENLTAPVEGVVGLTRALGTVSENGNSTEVKDEDLALSGRFTVTPLSAAEDGRRMTSLLDGDLYTIGVAAPAGSSRDFAPYLAGAGAGVLLVGLVAFAWPTLKWHGTKLLLFPLYARLKKEDVLENPLRDDILETVGQEPGISASELGRRLDCGWGTLVYHLTVLERMQLISSTKEGRYKRFFVQGRINYSDKGAVGLLANPAARTILDAVRSHPGIIQKDLSAQLGLSAGTIVWHAERLIGQGLLVKEEDGRSVRYFPSERLLDLTRRLAA